MKSEKSQTPTPWHSRVGEKKPSFPISPSGWAAQVPTVKLDGPICSLIVEREMLRLGRGEGKHIILAEASFLFLFFFVRFTQLFHA